MRSNGEEGEVKVYKCFSTGRRANRRRTSRARVIDEILLSVRLRLYESFESDDKSFENERGDLERSSEIYTLRGGKLF